MYSMCCLSDSRLLGRARQQESYYTIYMSDTPTVSYTTSHSFIHADRRSQRQKSSSGADGHQTQTQTQTQTQKRRRKNLK